MRKKHGLLVVLLLLFIIAGSVTIAADSGFTGVAYETKTDGTIGPKLGKVQITFIKTSDATVYTTSTDSNGQYSIKLLPAKYWVRACHVNYEDYCSIPGMFVVPGPGYQIGNFFLKKPRITTILLVRHAEKEMTSNDPPLTPQGDARARILADTAWKAGVTGIYTTDTVRTKATVQYLAQKLKLDYKIYGSPADVVSMVTSEHNGDTVLIAGHSYSMDDIANQFGGSVADYEIGDFDNLYVITRKITSTGTTSVNVINLQYGADSAMGEDTKGTYSMKTVLLLRHAETGIGKNPPLSVTGQARAQELVHVAKKAGVGAIYKTTSNRTTKTVEPLATALGLTPIDYSSGDIPGLITKINIQKKKVIVVATDDSTQTTEIIKKLKANPLPPVYTNEYDMLYVITLYTTGDAGITGLQYGAASP